MNVYRINVNASTANTSSIVNTIFDEHCIPHPIACLSRGSSIGASLNCIAAYDAINTIIIRRASPQMFEFLFVEKLHSLLKQFSWVEESLAFTSLSVQFITNDTLFYFIFGEGKFEITTRNANGQCMVDKYMIIPRGEIQSPLTLVNKKKLSEKEYATARHIQKISQAEDIIEEWSVSQIINGDFSKFRDIIILNTLISVADSLKKGGEESYIQFSFLNDVE